MNDLGKEIRRARKSKGMNQGQFAELARMDRAALSKLENNHRSARVDTLDYIADVLGMNLEIRFVERV